MTAKRHTVHLNDHAVYYVGTGCVRIGDAVVEMTVTEEDLFELLLRTPKVTVPWAVIERETCRANETTRHAMKGLRDKLGSRALKAHHGRGVSLQPQFVGAARYRLAAVRQDARAG